MAVPEKEESKINTLYQQKNGYFKAVAFNVGCTIELSGKLFKNSIYRLHLFQLQRYGGLISSPLQ